MIQTQRLPIVTPLRQNAAGGGPQYHHPPGRKVWKCRCKILDILKHLADSSVTVIWNSETENAIQVGVRYPMVAHHDMVESFDPYIQIEFLSSRADM
jgi:hypothetical protein